MKRRFITGTVLLFCFTSYLLAGGIYGDFTNDYKVDINDLSYFLGYWLADDCNRTAEVDLNDDCTVNGYEFSFFANNWMQEYTPTPSEPQHLMVPPQAFDDSSITLIWHKPSDYSNVVSYNVYQNGSYLGNTTKLFYYVTGLTADTAYSFTVKSVLSGGTESEAGNTCYATTADVPVVLYPEDYGAAANGTTKDTAAIQAAINACPAGGKVHLRTGKTFLSGAIFLKSNMTLKIDGTLQGTADPADYPQEMTRFEGTEQMGYSSLINVGNTLNHTYGGQIANVRICGSGTVSGGGTTLGDAQGGGRARGRLIYVVNASYVNLQGLTLANPPSWTVHLVYSTQLTVNGITANTVGIHNGDGCNPDSSSYVYIFDNTFNTGDDCIAIKSGRDLEGYNIGMPCHHIRITNCLFYEGHGGVVIGSESSGGVNNVFAQDCVSQGSDIGFRMKTAPARGGIVENITIKDWTMTGCTVAGIHIITNYPSGSGTPAPTLPICRNITVKNVTVDSTSYRGFYIVGQSSIHITDLLFENCNFNGAQLNALTYVDNMTFTGCTIVGGFSTSHCTNIIQN